jgi:hypothetical protein
VSLLIPLVLLLLSIPLVLALVRANELFLVRVQGGKARLVRGRIPPKLLGDIDDVAAATGASEAEVRAVVEDGKTAVYVHGRNIPRDMRQRLRNTISLWPVAKIRNAPKRLPRARRPRAGGAAERGCARGSQRQPAERQTAERQPAQRQTAERQPAQRQPRR